MGNPMAATTTAPGADGRRRLAWPRAKRERDAPRTRVAAWLLASVLFIPAAAWPCADEGDVVVWKLKLTDLNEADNQPFLSPGNDSRVNLQLLLLDGGEAQLHPQARAKDADRWPYPTLSGPAPFTPDDLNAMIEPPPAAPTLAAGATLDHADGEGSRCNSNASGLAQFSAALDASGGVPAPERAALIAARAALKPSCADNPGTVPVEPPQVQVQSNAAKPFATYLAGAHAFYDGRFDVAAKDFALLQNTAQPWLRETARYMEGRVALNRAQWGAFDEYGTLNRGSIDARALMDAKGAFDGYLRLYPAGTYSASARGLLRRVAWLGDKTDALSQDIAEALDVSDPKARNVSEVDLVQEADNHLLMAKDATGMSDPRLLAAFDLLHMRKSSQPNVPDRSIARAVLEAQRPSFVRAPALFDYLLAAHAFYDEGDPRSAITLLSVKSPKGPMSYLEFSRQVLHAMALEETGDHAAARALWFALMPEARPPFQHAALELGLAMNDERGGALEAVYAAGSPITDPDIREILLRNDAGAVLLRQQARSGAPEHERRTAIYALLYKEATRGRYEAFVNDLALLPPPPAKAPGDDQPKPDPDFTPFRWDGHSTEGYICPPLRAFASVLARNPKDPQSLVCLDEFVRIGELDGDALDKPPAKDELGGGPSQFPGGPYSRLESYKTLLADPKTPGGVRSYVLYRAVECYAPSGYDQCGGKDVPKSQRRLWFRALKTGYPGTVWAKQLKYYW
jgi:hypothetical protein